MSKEIPVEHEVFIVTASGAQPHKAVGSLIHLTEESALDAAIALNADPNNPARYGVHRMLMRSAPKNS